MFLSSQSAASNICDVFKEKYRYISPASPTPQNCLNPNDMLCRPGVPPLWTERYQKKQLKEARQLQPRTCTTAGPSVYRTTIERWCSALPHRTPASELPTVLSRNGNCLFGGHQHGDVGTELRWRRGMPKTVVCGTMPLYLCLMTAEVGQGYEGFPRRNREEIYLCEPLVSMMHLVLSRSGCLRRDVIAQESSVMEYHHFRIVVFQAQVVCQVTCPQNGDSSQELDALRSEDLLKSHISLVHSGWLYLVCHKLAQ